MLLQKEGSLLRVIIGFSSGGLRRCCRLDRVGPSRLTLKNLVKVARRESDPASIQMERHLPAVGECAEYALGYLRKPKASEDLGSFGWSEEMRKLKSFDTGVSVHAGVRPCSPASDLAAGNQGRSAAVGKRELHRLRNGAPSCPVGIPFPAS
jgi:hypothetical protein